MIGIRNQIISVWLLMHIVSFLLVSGLDCVILIVITDWLCASLSQNVESTFMFSFWLKLSCSFQMPHRRFLDARPAVHQVCFYQHSNDAFFFYKLTLRSYFKVLVWILPLLGLQKVCWSYQMEMEDRFLPNLTRVERHNLTGWCLCQNKFDWLTKSTGFHNTVLSERT